MAKQIARLLKADLNEMGDLKAIAKMLQSKGRGGDTMLAHITKREAEILKAAGGAGTTNPETGLPEFYEADALDTWFNNYYDSGAASAPAVDTTPVATEPAPYVPTSADAQARYSNEAYTGYGGNTDRAALYGAEGYGEYQAQPELFSGSGMTMAGRGETGVTPGKYYGLSASPAQISAFGPQPTDYKPGYGLTETYAPQAAQTPLETAPKTEKSWYDKLSTDQMIRLGLIGGLGLYGAQQSKQAAKQGQQAAEEMKALGAPYQAKGTELQRAAAAGELTPAGQQSMQALQARLAQGVEQRGGVGAAQAAAQLEAYRQTLLQNQYDYGLKVSQIGDSIALGAIRTGMQADQQLNQANTNFYTQLAMIGAGVPIVRG